MSGLFLPAAARDEVGAFFEPRAAAVDRGEITIREGLAFLHRGVLASGERDPNADLEHVARTIATVAWSDLASAFSLWSHRMVLEYLARADGSMRQWTRRLLDVSSCGSTALAAPIAHYLGQTRLALTCMREDGLVVSGRIRWASNLFAPDFVIVSAALADDEIVPFMTHGGASGLAVDPYPRLIALQATGSSSLRLDNVRVPAGGVLADRFTDFIGRVRPPFLVLQSSFCWGLACRALDEAASALGGAALVLREDLDGLGEEAERVAAAIGHAARTRATPVRDLVQLRLDTARLAVSATALEAKVVGSRSFIVESPTARRLREAAFLPIQAPTEAQLRSELAAAEELVAR